MINNYFQDDYKPWHKIFTDSSTNNALYLGDISSALDRDFIKSQNIRTVVTVAADMNHVRFQDDIHHVVYPIYDSKSQSINQLFLKFIELVEKQIIIGNILVHCFAGISRSATLIIAYLMKKCNLSFREAIQLVRKQRASVCPNYGFEMQLKQFQKKLKNQNLSKVTKKANSHKHRINHIQLELPQLNVSLLRKTQLKTKIVNPGNFFCGPQKRIKINRDNDSINLYQPQSTIHRPVLKFRSLSHLESRDSVLQKKQSKRISKEDIKFIPIIKTEPLNERKYSSITSRRVNSKYGYKYSDVKPI